MSPARPPDPLLRGRDLDAAAFARTHGMDPPQLLRATLGTALYRCGERVIRISRPERTSGGTGRTLAASGLLCHHGVAAAAAADAVVYRTECGEDVTVWVHVPNDAGRPFPAFQLGQVVRRLHTIPLTVAAAMLGGELPTLTATTARGRARVARLELAAAAGRDTGASAGQLSAAFERLHDAFVVASRASAPVLLHGDLNNGNVLWGVLDHPVLCDFEDLTQGPWAWDLVRTQVEVARGLQPPADLDALIAGYGKDPATCPGWAAMCQWSAFRLTTWYMAEALSGTQDMATARTLMAWFGAGFPGLPALEPTPAGR